MSAKPIVTFHYKVLYHKHKALSIITCLVELLW